MAHRHVIDDPINDRQAYGWRQYAHVGLVEGVPVLGKGGQREVVLALLRCLVEARVSQRSGINDLDQEKAWLVVGESDPYGLLGAGDNMQANCPRSGLTDSKSYLVEILLLEACAPCKRDRDEPGRPDVCGNRCQRKLDSGHRSARRTDRLGHRGVNGENLA